MLASMTWRRIFLSIVFPLIYSPEYIKNKMISYLQELFDISFRRSYVRYRILSDKPGYTEEVHACNLKVINLDKVINVRIEMSKLIF